MAKIRLIIADDHPMVTDGLVAYFGNSTHIEVIATANEPSEAKKMVEKHSPDILMVDYHFQNENTTGLDICRYVSANFPCTKIIVISSFSEVLLVNTFVEAGASGYLLKTASRQQFIEAVMNVFAGGEYFSSDIRELLVSERLNKGKSETVKFTKTEKEILNLIIQGYSTREIAKMIFREKTTVDSHRKSILSKFQLMDSDGSTKSKNIMYYVNKLGVEKKIDCL